MQGMEKKPWQRTIETPRGKSLISSSPQGTLRAGSRRKLTNADKYFLLTKR